MRNGQQNKKNKSQHSYEVQRANERGVFGVRRLVAEESYETLDQITAPINKELKNIGFTFESESIATTVVGFSSFCRKHKVDGPPTAEITERVPSTKQPIVATLGRIGIYGPCTKTKLAIELQSNELLEEEKLYEEEYAKASFPLSNRWPYNPHCSVAVILPHYVEHFKDPRIINKLNRLAGLGKMTEVSIVLEPVKPNG